MTPRARFLAWTFELDRVARVLAILREELAFRFLDEVDLLQLSAALYGRAERYARGSAHNESGLFPFEDEALATAFPRPPASILVGGCGGGRELLALVERGYNIAAAYDPVATFVEALRADPRLVEVRERLFVGSHQALVSTPAFAALTRSQGAIDAVVLGWGSFTHVLGAERRVEFLRALCGLCPRGPVLLSFFVEAAEEAARPRRLRLTLRRMLGSSAAHVEPGDALLRAAGGVHYFTRSSFEREVAQGGYRIAHWQEHDRNAAHAVLLPRTPPERS